MISLCRSYWTPDGEGGFLEGTLESENGAKCVVSIGHEKKTFKREQLQQVVSLNLKRGECAQRFSMEM